MGILEKEREEQEIRIERIKSHTPRTLLSPKFWDGERLVCGRKIANVHEG